MQLRRAEMSVATPIREYPEEASAKAWPSGRVAFTYRSITACCKILSQLHEMEFRHDVTAPVDQ